MNELEFNNYCIAGEIANKIRKEFKKKINHGDSLIKIAEEIEEEIKKKGARPAFPVNISINEIAAHYTPSLDDKTKAHGLIKIDLGVEFNGYIADLAFSLDLTKEKKYEKMIELNEKILDLAIDSLNVNSRVKDIGNFISSLMNKEDFRIVKNLTGHCLDKYEIHANPPIPNTPNENETLLEGKAFAIEPFLTLGIGEVLESMPSEIFMLVSNKKPRDAYARILLDFIKKEYKTKPFCKRWLEKEGFKTKFSLKILENEGIIYCFPILIEKSRMEVSQSEETVVIFNGIKKVITK